MDSSKDKSENLLVGSNQYKLSEYLTHIKTEAEKHTELLKKTKRELEEATAHNEKLFNILQRSFIYKTYKALNPDLKDFDNQSLLQHYISHGFEEGRQCDEDSTRDLEMAKYAYQRTRIMQELARGHLCTHNSQQDKQENNTSNINNDNKKISKTIGTRISLDANKDFKFAMEHTLYEPRTKCLATFIPKNGCTNLRYSFALASNLISNPEDIDWVHANNRSMNADLENIQNSHYSFVILRNPYERLASAFWNKFVDVEGDHYTAELSGKAFHDIFNKSRDNNSINSFKSFVNALWEDPMLISKDTHLRYQTDFLIFSNYTDYFSLNNFKTLQKKVNEKCNLTIIDTRQITHHTTYGYEKAKDNYYGSCSIKELRSIKEGKMSIKYDNFYDEEDSYKVTSLYINDIAAYIEKTKDLDSLRDYLYRGLHYSTNYQI